MGIAEEVRVWGAMVGAGVNETDEARFGVDFRRVWGKVEEEG